jgi:hypothetical protein
MEQEIELSKVTFKYTMINFKVEEGHAEFTIKVLGPVGITFHIIDRYSSMRDFATLLKNNLTGVDLADLPSFPKKKIMGSTDP